MKRPRPSPEEDDDPPRQPVMAVKSVRLPLALWERLDATVRDANLCPRRNLTVSWLIRSLLERGLDDPAGPPIPGRNVARPQRVLDEMARRRAEEKVVEPVLSAKMAVTDTSLPDTDTDCADVFARLLTRVRCDEITCNMFLGSIGGDRELLSHFYYKGVGPDGPANRAIVDAVRVWLEKK